jgi:hypothetical protein
VLSRVNANQRLATLYHVVCVPSDVVMTEQEESGFSARGVQHGTIMNARDLRKDMLKNALHVLIAKTLIGC